MNFFMHLFDKMPSQVSFPCVCFRALSYPDDVYMQTRVRFPCALSRNDPGTPSQRWMTDRPPPFWLPSRRVK